MNGRKNMKKNSVAQNSRGHITKEKQNVAKCAIAHT
jgi:hypothetical protein